MDESDFSCSICFTTYGSKLLTPRVLPCGHTHCTNCIERVMLTNRKCGECRTAIGKKIDEHPVNYAILRLLEDKKKDVVENKTHEYEEFKQLDGQIETLVKDLDNTKRDYKRTIDRLEKKITTVETKKELLSKSKDLLSARTRELRKTESLSKVKALCEETLKLSLVTTNKMSLMDQIKFDVLEEKVLPYFQLPGDFYVDFGSNVWADLKRGNETDKLYIGNVKRGPANPYPTSKTSILVSEFRSQYCGAHLLLKACKSIFSVDIEIFRSPNGYFGGRASQFLSFCTGEYGPCIVGTKLFKHSRAGREGESVQGGDHDDKGGKAIIKGLDKGKMANIPITAGLIAGTYNERKTPTTVFEIFIEGWPNKKTNLSFGRITRGRAFLQKALEMKLPISVIESSVAVDFVKKIGPFKVDLESKSGSRPT